MSTQSSEKFEQLLDEAMQKMKACQTEHHVGSCSKCEKFIGCEIRAAYVQSVYDSMSKGETGGFEF